MSSVGWMFCDMSERAGWFVILACPTTALSIMTLVAGDL